MNLYEISVCAYGHVVVRLYASTVDIDRAQELAQEQLQKHQRNYSFPPYAFVTRLLCDGIANEFVTVPFDVNVVVA